MEFIPVKSILQKTADGNSMWFGNDYNMNLYKGCSHGCIYCDSRSSCYGIQDFDRVRGKENALIILEKELRSKRRTGVAGIGAMSDSYNPFEKKYEITRGALKLLAQYGYGASFETKSDLAVRDIDILNEIKKYAPVIAKFTITTADDDLSGKIESGVCVSSRRFEAVRKMNDAGIYCGVLFTPMLPLITDTEKNVREIVKQASLNGAKFVYCITGVTLRENQREHYYQKLDQLFPGVKEKYIRLYHNQYVCNSPRQKELWMIFKEECQRYNMLYKMKDIIKAYKKPYMVEQLNLFEL